MPLDAALVLLAAGVGAGLVGSVAGIASLVSYPALLAYGLPPLAANVTNSTSMLALTVGAVAGSRPELSGHGRRLVVLSAQMCVGGAVGAALLLLTPARAFEVLVPWLVGFGALLLLAKERVRRLITRVAGTAGPPGRSTSATIVVLLVAVYAGYFGAGSGIILLAVLAIRHAEPLAVTNAIKNVGTGVANAVATIAYLVVAPVDLQAAALLGAGALVGAWIGPQVVRVLPERPLQLAIGTAGLVLAFWLWQR